VGMSIVGGDNPGPITDWAQSGTTASREQA
jgi:hypothetical protein